MHAPPKATDVPIITPSQCIFSLNIIFVFDCQDFNYYQIVKEADGIIFGKYTFKININYLFI